MRLDRVTPVVRLEQQEELVDHVERDQQPDLDGDHEHEQDFAPRIIEREEQDHGEDRARRSDLGHVLVASDVEEGPAQRADDRGTEVEGGEVFRPVHRLHLTPDEPEEQHVPEQVHEAGVQERGCHQLPDIAVLENVAALRGEPLVEQVLLHEPELSQEEDRHVGDDDRPADGRGAGKPEVPRVSPR